MTKDLKAQKLMRLFPVLTGVQQRKAYSWLEKHGYLRGSVPPQTQTYTVKSPPGRGRLERVPMYLELLGSGGEGLGYYNTNVITDAGAGTAANENSVTLINMPGNKFPVLNQYDSTKTTDTTFGHYVISGMTFSTKQAPWAKMRVVGLETVINYTPMSPLAPAQEADTDPLGIGLASPPRIMLKNFRVSGSANLFIQDGYIDGTFFDVERLLMGGLRAYPILKSPKTLKCDIAVMGEHYHADSRTLTDIMTYGVTGGSTPLGAGTITVPYATDYSFSVNAIVDVLDDTTYGESLTGPATRGLNMVRTPPKRGQSFIVGE